MGEQRDAGGGARAVVMPSNAISTEGRRRLMAPPKTANQRAATNTTPVNKKLVHWFA